MLNLLGHGKCENRCFISRRGGFGNMCHDEGTGLIGLGWVLEERKGVLLLFLFVMADV